MVTAAEAIRNIGKEVTVNTKTYGMSDLNGGIFFISGAMTVKETDNNGNIRTENKIKITERKNKSVSYWLAPEALEFADMDKYWEDFHRKNMEKIINA